MLNIAPLCRWHNLIVPEHDAITPDDGRTLPYHLHDRIRRANAFVLCAGMYASYSSWIEHEVGFARRIGCPIICVATWGAQRLPASADFARVDVSRAATLVQAIRDLSVARP